MLTIPQLKVLSLAVLAASVQSCATHSVQNLSRPLPYVLADGTQLVGWEIGEPSAQGQFGDVTLRYTQRSAPHMISTSVVRLGGQFHGFVLREITVHPETIGVSGGPIAAILIQECVFGSLDNSSSFVLVDDEGTQYVQLRRANT